MICSAVLQGCGQTEVASEQATVAPSKAPIPTHEPIVFKTPTPRDEEEVVAISEDAIAEEPNVSANEAHREEKLHYIDAWGEWHDTVINPRVKKHAYDLSLLKNDGQNISYEDDRYIIRKGIDVSHHQGAIDFAQVKAAGYEFVILRAAYRGYGTEGTLNQDKNFYTYLQDAHAAGLEVGVYIFSQAISEAEAKEEADFILGMLAGQQIELPIVYDPESIRDDKARTDGVSGEQFTKNTQMFCSTIRHAGYEPMIYSNMIWEADFLDLEALSEYPIWYADYELIPQTPYDYAYWQYTSDGKVPGIAGRVDLDVQFILR